MRRPFVAGNWKMHHGPGTAAALAAEVRAFEAGVPGVDLAVFPPFVSLSAVVRVLEGCRVEAGAQNLHGEPKGAFTGEVAGGMIAEVGATRVLVGHSERRRLFGETDDLVGRKLRAAFDAGLAPILCIGETLEERRSGKTHDVLDRQLRASLVELSAERLARVTVAYEPVWAIGTGVNATPEECEEAHRHVRSRIAAWCGREAAEGIRILYGGSVTAQNAASLLGRPGVDGALVGGASLEATSFRGIAEAASKIAGDRS